PRTVAIASLAGGQPPEVLDSAATIARRTIQLADPFEDMGAMMLRHLTWRMFERSGDGSATAAVLANSIAQEAARYVAAGDDAAAIRRGLDRAAECVLAALRRQARPIDLTADLAALVCGSLGDAKLADMIGEVVDAVGPDGSIVVEAAQGRETVLEYVDGVR